VGKEGDRGAARKPAGSAQNARDVERRVLLLLPFGRDAELAEKELGRAGFEPEACRHLKDFSRCLREGAGVALLGEEVLGRGAAELFRVFDEQETWSDLPVIVLLRHDGPLPDALLPLRAFERHPKIKTTFLQRPVPALSLVSSVRAGLRSRLRQYQVRDLLEQLNDDVRLRDEFLAMLGHELRNPVSSIGYVSEIFEMNDGALTPERVAWGASVISRQVRHLSRLLDQLLDVARVQSGKIELEAERIDLRTVAEQCIETARVEGRGRKLTLKLPDRPIVVRGDRVRLSQVVNNLLENAVKYTPEGGRIELEVGSCSDMGRISVSDDGRGMDASVLSHVFKPFFQEGGYQEGGSRAGRSAGLGLGLAMADNIVRLHGGTIAASSEGVGRGSRFELRLPRLDEAPAGEREGREAGSDAPASRRVIIVEDDVEVAELFAMLLKSLGHQAEVVHSGFEGVEAAKASAADIVFIDIGLPHLDGAETARRIRAAFPTDGPRLVALTGLPERAEDGDAPFDDYLLKPVSRQRVQELIGKL
jgi:signal transduction histidine kinase/CheY-like chemotaxis protein